MDMYVMYKAPLGLVQHWEARAQDDCPIFESVLYSSAISSLIFHAVLLAPEEVITMSYRSAQLGRALDTVHAVVLHQDRCQ